MKKIAQKGKKVDFYGKRCYVGVDVRKLAYYAALLSEDGMSMEFSGPVNPAGLISQIRDMGVDIICLAHESCPTGYEIGMVLPREWYQGFGSGNDEDSA